MRTQNGFFAIAAVLGGAIGCGSGHGDAADTDALQQAEVGSATVALTNAPSDAACLRITVAGTRTDVRSFALTPGKKASFDLKGLPVGTDAFSAETFQTACSGVNGGSSANWYSEPVSVKISASETAHVALLMIHNGKASVAIDFSDKTAPSSTSTPPLSGGVFSSVKPYLVAVDPKVKIKAILTTGDAVGTKPDGTPYRMVGIPDGLGAFDNGDGTFTLLSNHELSGNGIARAHGGKGAFVSKWTIRKADLGVLKGEDLMKQVALWDAGTTSYDPPTTGTVFSRFCSADLPAPSALFDAVSGLGFDGRLFFDGEESGVEGRPLAHGLDGTSYETPRLGNMAFENSVANPGTGTTTVVAALDDTSPLGQVYFYVGTKTGTGNPVDKAGLTNGALYGLKVDGVAQEDAAAGIATGPFSLYSFGNVENWTGAMLDTASSDNGVTKLQRPEDGTWDPNNPNEFYFVTTASFTGNSRLWHLHFTDARHPELGGQIEMLLDGTEGHKMFDNITMDHYGHVYAVEDVGGNDHLGKVYRYDVATDTLSVIATADPALFDPASPTFVTNDEEASGIIDASDVLGAGWLLLDAESHKASADPELVEGGQFMAIYDPAAAGL